MPKDKRPRGAAGRQQAEVMVAIQAKSHEIERNMRNSDKGCPYL